MTRVDFLHAELIQSGHLYLQCEGCNYGSHGFFLEVLHWKGDDVDTFEAGLQIHCTDKDSLWTRLRWAWRVLWGQEYKHEIVLNEAQMVQLDTFIQDQVKVLNWHKKAEVAE